MEEERFITEYNKLINRIKKAEKFLESDTYIGKDKKPHKYQSLEEEIKYKEITGYKIPMDEFMEGFCN